MEMEVYILYTLLFVEYYNIHVKFKLRNFFFCFLNDNNGMLFSHNVITQYVIYREELLILDQISLQAGKNIQITFIHYLRTYMYVYIYV